MAAASVPRHATLSYLWRLVMLVGGLLVFGYGITMTLGSGLGLGPWDVLHQGVSLHLPLSFGQASIATGAVVILIGLGLQVRPGIATICNMGLVGLFIDFVVANGLLIDVRGGPLVARVALDLAGIAVMGLGSALYIKAAMGAGPRDGLMLVLSRLSGQRVALVRAALETAVLVLGFVLGGTVGIGTVLFAVGIGPAVDLSFQLMGVPNPAKSRQAKDPRPAVLE
ncbi:MAG TPA: hypothetical protein VM347_38860 [Nonomuraea sp.]|nr:hypothetical protein [Nonomuraea sp.]